ncbi:uncharacterized protein LOC129806198 [Phlebotomus papatasi]|uniref:uncharacterized protein LOC129806198 n=1 Tax=Phlebotomus papatasi TaxID=29031 RepID=UPI0024840AA6|nr:uncharacterized protein LOC129806198 [Phlebotomus papatasi]
MYRNSSTESEEEAGFTVGEPTLAEIKEYFSSQYCTAESSSSDSSGELSESFVELLNKREQELNMEKQCKYPFKRVPRTSEVPLSQDQDEAGPKCLWMTGIDDSFLAAEKLCEQTLEYNRYMSKDMPKSDFPDITVVDDETILNDVEPPSMLCEQTMIRGTPGKITMGNRPSTILEEATIASTDECSFYTAEIARTITRASSDESTTSTRDQSGDVIELSDESDESDAISQVASSVSSAAQNSTEDSTQESAQESTLNISREFNDTLEKVEYMLKKGEKLLKSQPNPSGMVTPPASSSSQGSGSSSGAVLKKTNTSGFKQPRIPSKIPQIRGKKYDYVKSPISAYIHKTPTVPLFTVSKPFEEKIRGASSPRTDLQEELKENLRSAGNSTPPKPRIFPKKACISAPYALIRDERESPNIPGGPKMHALLGDKVNPEKAPIVVRTMGKYKTMRLPPEVVEQERRKMSLTEDSMAELSIASGDVSIHVVKDAIKF